MPLPYHPVRRDPRKMRYISWLITPPDERIPKSENALADELDVHVKTLYGWRQDREFRETWADAAKITYGDNDHKLAIIDALVTTALDNRNPRQVSAAKLYFEMTGAMTPSSPELRLNGPQALGLLTDGEIEKLVAIGLAEMRRDEIIDIEEAEPDDDGPLD